MDHVEGRESFRQQETCSAQKRTALSIRAFYSLEVEKGCSYAESNFLHLTKDDGEGLGAVLCAAINTWLVNDHDLTVLKEKALRS